MWHVFPAMPRVGTTDLRNAMIPGEVKSMGVNSLIVSSHYSLDAPRVSMRLLATAKRTLPENDTVGIWA